MKSKEEIKELFKEDLKGTDALADNIMFQIYLIGYRRGVTDTIQEDKIDFAYFDSVGLRKS